MDQRCNICGSTTFQPGFNNRLTFGLPPACSECGSYERHRISYIMYSALSPLFAEWRALQFAPDCSVKRNWFKEYVGSVYGSSNSYNMMDSGLPEGRFDIIISNHVLEHVSDDIVALQEMLRVAGDNGIVALTVPTPTMRWETIDWDFPDPAKNYHYRDYGADFPQRVASKIRGIEIAAVSAADPATGIYDIVYFFSNGTGHLEKMAGIWNRIPLPIVRLSS